MSKIQSGQRPFDAIQVFNRLPWGEREVLARTNLALLDVEFHSLCFYIDIYIERCDVDRSTSLPPSELGFLVNLLAEDCPNTRS